MDLHALANSPLQLKTQPEKSSFRDRQKSLETQCTGSLRTPISGSWNFAGRGMVQLGQGKRSIHFGFFLEAGPSYFTEGKQVITI